MVKLRKDIGKYVPKEPSGMSLQILNLLENNFDNGYTTEDISKELKVNKLYQNMIPILLNELEIQHQIEKSPEKEHDGTIKFYYMAKKK